MKKDEPSPIVPAREAAGSGVAATPDAAPADVPRVEREVVPGEMGGEAPCQLHRFWDVDDE
jgi:hypothetical protein